RGGSFTSERRWGPAPARGPGGGGGGRRTLIERLVPEPRRHSRTDGVGIRALLRPRAARVDELHRARGLCGRGRGAQPDQQTEATHGKLKLDLEQIVEDLTPSPFPAPLASRNERSLSNRAARSLRRAQTRRVAAFAPNQIDGFQSASKPHDSRPLNVGKQSPGIALRT